MADRDEWGRDPAVQIMRGVFAATEQTQHELLGRLGIAPSDPRLRRWWEQALLLRSTEGFSSGGKGS
jgi:hypothetical protein